MGGRGDEPVRGTSALTVEGDLPGSLAISLHEALRSGILWIASRSCPVGLPMRPSGYRIPAFIRTCSDECGRCSDEVDIQGVDRFLLVLKCGRVFRVCRCYISALERGLSPGW